MWLGEDAPAKDQMPALWPIHLRQVKTDDVPGDTLHGGGGSAYRPVEGATLVPPVINPPLALTRSEIPEVQ